jgi:PAS domain S-box-containing protein
MRKPVKRNQKRFSLIRVLIVDDHEVVRQGVRSLLAERSDFQVCGEAVDGQDGLEKAKQLKPDVVVMDISMPRLNGFEATRLIHNVLPHIGILILSQHESPEIIKQALRAGARGYVVKSSIANQLENAVEAVSRGNEFVAAAPNLASHVDPQEVLQRSAALERELGASEERFRATFEQAPVGVAHLDRDGRWLRVNQKFCQILGYTTAELAQMRYQDITHPDDLVQELVEAQKISEGKSNQYSIEKRYARGDGSWVWVARSVSAVRDAAGHLQYLISVIQDITERKHGEQKLWASQQRLALAQIAGKSGTFEWNLKTGVNYWSPEIKELYGMKPGEFGGTQADFLSWVLPEDRAEAERITNEGLRTGEFNGEFRIRRRDGAIRTVSARGKVFFDENGQPDKMIGSNVDITEHKQAEQASARLAAIVESSADAIISKDLSGIITSWNASAERIFEYSAQEAIGHPITIIIPSELRGEEAQILKRLSNGERIEHFETVRVTKRGQRLNVSLTVSPMRDSQGTVIGASKIARDITERKRTKKDLRDNQELLRAAFAQTYSFLALLAIDATVLEANRAALEGTGFTRREVIGRKLWEVWWHSLPEEQALAKTSMATAAKGLAVREECQYALRDGSVRFLDRTLNPVQNERGEVVMIVASGLDITEHRQLRSMLEERVRERTGELEMKNVELMRQAEVVRELSARLLQIQDEERRRIARELHDSVGQMLAAVGMNIAQVHREAELLSPAAVKALEDNAGLMEQISSEIRTISHLLHPPLLDEVGLQSALQWYIDGFSERSKIDVDLELPEDFGRLPRNLEITLFRVVQECLTNIHRHSGSSTAAIRVARSENEVRLEVRDAGKGIPAETQATMASGKLSGVGLRGMHERLRQMGGQLEVRSNGSGTLVFATLPIEVRAAKEATASARGAA